jgi:hypothetical protein
VASTAVDQQVVDHLPNLVRKTNDAGSGLDFLADGNAGALELVADSGQLLDRNLFPTRKAPSKVRRRQLILTGDKLHLRAAVGRQVEGEQK